MREGGQKMREKDGFSLIELVITIAIMGILVGLSAFSLNYISQADARKMTGEINSAFSELKTLNMSKNTTAYMHLYQYDGDFYIKYDGSASCTPDDTGHKIGKDNMKIQVDSTELGSGDVYSLRSAKRMVPLLPLQTVATHMYRRQRLRLPMIMAERIPLPL